MYRVCDVFVCLWLVATYYTKRGSLSLQHVDGPTMGAIRSDDMMAKIANLMQFITSCERIGMHAESTLCGKRLRMYRVMSN